MDPASVTPQGTLHGQGLPVALGVGLHQVVAVGGHAGPRDGAVDGGATGPRVLQGFDHEHGRALTQYEAVTVDVPRAGGALRVVVAAREGVHVGEGCNGQRVDDRLTPADDGHVGAPQTQHVDAEGNGLVGGGAG